MVTSDIHHVVGYGWRSGIPELYLFDGTTRPFSGHTTLGLTGERRCVGWWDRAIRVRHSCQSDLPATKPQCTECSRREGFWRCMTCDGFACPPLSPEIHSYCRSEHILYLANFGTERVKIGTSLASRGFSRIIEQGPVAAIQIARAPGPIIKQMESYGVQFGLAETMSRSQKWKAWRQCTDTKMPRRWLADALEMYASRLPEHYSPHLHKPSPVTYTDSVATTDLLARASLLTMQAGTVIRGTVEKARGHILVLNDGAGYVALDMAALKGHLVDFSPSGGTAQVRQLGLFD